MKNTGQILKDKRESLNLTISEVALSTKINPKILAAMELGESQNLPAQTFLRGFVRSYASYLKLDTEMVMKSFQEEMAPVLPEKPADFRNEVSATVASSAAPRARKVETDGTSTMKGVAVGAIVVLIGLIFGIRELIEKYQKETVVEQPTDLKATPLPEVANEPAAVASTPEAQPSESQPSTAAANPAATTPTPAPAEPVIETTVAIPETAELAPLISMANTPSPEDMNPLAAFVAKNDSIVQDVIRANEKKIEATVTPAKVDAKEELKKVEEQASATVAPPDAAANAAATTSPKSSVKRNEIILEALDKVDVKFDIKGQTKKLSLAPTQVHTIRADGPVEMDFSDGGAVNIIINGQERGVPGDLGKPKQVKIP